MRATIAESLEIERGKKVAKKSLSPTSQLRRELLHGGIVVPSKGDAKHRALATVTIAHMKEWGFKFKMEEVGRSANGLTAIHGYRLTNPGHVPTEADFDRGRAKARAAKPRTTKKAPAKKVSKKPVSRSNGKAALPVKVDKVVDVRVNGATLPAAASARGGDLGIPFAPSLGGNLQVFLLHLDDDGSVNLGLRDGDRRWQVKVEGYVVN